jgi:hypothetical protein
MEEIIRKNREKKLPKWSNYHTASLIGILFMSFVVGWVFAIPIAVVAFLAYGFVAYRKELRNRIAVAIKPNEAMRAVLRREEELKREKELLMEERMSR